MTPIILDSSVVIKWIISENEKYLEQADKVLDRIKSGSLKCYAPELLKYEIGNVMISKQCTTSYINLAFKTIYSLPIGFIACDLKLAYETAIISKESSITFYDALFIALAKKIKANLITDNIKHQGRYKDKEIKIIALKDYR